jgi:cytochrome c oxidase subunit 3
MPGVSFPNSIEFPKTGGGGDLPPVNGGGDGSGGGGDGSQNSLPNYGQRLRRARLGLIVGLASVTMIFVSLTSALIFRQGLPTFDTTTSSYVRDWIPLNLPLALLLVNTVLLLASSLSAELARRQIKRQAALAPVLSIPGVSLGNEQGFPWLLATLVLGCGFIAGQWLAWRELAARGFYLATNASSSFFYLLTATHAVHVTGGLLVLLYAGAASLLHRPVEKRRIVVDVAAWYWHFMFLLWIYIFTLLWLVR